MLSGGYILLLRDLDETVNFRLSSGSGYVSTMLRILPSFASTTYSLVPPTASFFSAEVPIVYHPMLDIASSS